MSSISQMERSSSQTRMLPMRSSSRRRYSVCGVERRRMGLTCGAGWGRSQTLSGRETAQAKHKHAALPQLGARPDLPFVSLDDLVDDCQTKAGATFKL